MVSTEMSTEINAYGLCGKTEFYVSNQYELNHGSDRVLPS